MITNLVEHPLVRAVGRALVGAAVLALGLGLGLLLVSPDWTTAVTLVGIAAIFTLIFVDQLDGFLVWMVLAPYARFIYLDIKLGRGIPDLGLTRLCAGLLTLILLAQMARRQRQPLRVNWIDAMALTFGAGIMLSASAASIGLIAAAQTIMDFLWIPMLIYYLARHLVREPGDLGKALAAVFLIGMYLAVLTTREQLTGEVLFRGGDWGTVYSPHIRKVIGLLNNPAAMGTAQAVVLPFAVYAGLYAPARWQRWPAWLIVLLLLAGITLTYVRGAWLGALVSLLVLAAYDGRLRRVILVTCLVGGLLVALFWGPISQSWIVRERLATDRPIEYRLTALDLVRRMVARDPLFGIGYGNFGRVANAMYAWDPDRSIYVEASPHNSFLYILASGGLVALLPYVGLFVAIAGEGWRLFRHTRRLRCGQPALLVTLWAAEAAYVIAAATFDIPNAQFTNMLFFLVVGITIGSQEAAVAKAMSDFQSPLLFPGPKASLGGRTAVA